MELAVKGIVSNCFAHQLQAGQTLEDLVHQVVSRGYSTVELRQTCMGECESQEYIVDPIALKRLCEPYPDVDFDYAMNYPFLSAGHEHLGDEYLEAGIRAAFSCKTNYRPHLRLVDLSTSNDALDDAIKATSRNLAELVKAITQRGVRLSLEHSRQRWELFSSVCDQLDTLNLTGDYELCFDPANFCTSDIGSKSLEVLAALDLNHVSMIHLKQFNEGTYLEVLENGHIDWKVCAELLREKQYAGPLLFEIIPSNQVWDRLDESLEYWTGLQRKDRRHRPDL